MGGYITNSYLGLSFNIMGRPIMDGPDSRFISGGDQCMVTLTGYAYETIPNRAIIAGKTKGPDVIEPASLGHLAAGASAIPAWRVKSTAATSH